MVKTCRAIQIVEPEKAKIVEIAVPEPAPDEVLIRIEACATCTNWELKTWRGVDIFGAPVAVYPKNPGAPGHEAAGTVVECGAEVEGVKIGDKVAIMGSHRGPENDAHAEYVTRPAAHLAHLAPDTDPVLAAPLEMGLCVVRSLEVAGDVAGRNIAVVGLGPAGVMHLQLLRAAGAAHTVGIDAEPARLEAAAPFASQVVDGRETEEVERLGELGVTLAFDCSGNPKGLATGLRLAHEALIVFSVPDGDITWGKPEWLRGVAIRPYHWRGGDQFACLRQAARHLAEGVLDTRPLVGAVLPYTRYEEGLTMLAERKALKVVFQGWE